MKDSLFQPITINKLEIKNRIYLPAMHLGMADGFLVTDQLINFYAERAKGGAGMIVVGNATVDDRSGNTQYIGAHDDAHIEGLTKLSAAIKDNGSLSAVQLNHAGRYNHSLFMDGRKAVAPSPIASALTKEEPEELDIDGINQIVESFGDAALRVKKSGFDAVEVLSGTGYLISEFLSPLTNHRTDDYGGSLENRMRFGLEVMASIRKKVGDEFPVIVRMDNKDFMKGGQDRKELEAYAVALEKAGIDALCVKGGWHEARVPQLTPNVPRGMYGYLAKRIKNLVKIPVIASHRINDPETARELIHEGFCDMVAMGRSLIADPFLPEKAKQGREDEIIHCIACAQGCFDNLFKLKHIECMCNPRAGFEGKKEIQKTTSAKKIMVVGSGAAGMSAALAAAEKGHHVTVYEKSDTVGGQLYIAAAPPGRAEFAELAVDLGRQIEKSTVQLVLNTEVTEDLITTEKPDAVILATGAVPLAPPIPGSDRPNVVQAWDVLTDSVEIGEHVAVIGGGAVGVETALFLAEIGTLPADVVKFLLVNKAEDYDTLYDLAVNGSKKVTIVEMIAKIGKDIGKSTKWGMFQEMDRHNIKALPNTTAKEITEAGVVVDDGESTYVIPADTVVMAAGSASYNPLEQYLIDQKIPYKTAGDVEKIGLAFDAVHNGYAAGADI